MEIYYDSVIDLKMEGQNRSCREEISGMSRLMKKDFFKYCMEMEGRHPNIDWCMLYTIELL